MRRPEDDAAAAAFDREYALVDCTLEFRELMLEGSPLEVFAVDPRELSSVNGAEVPDYGAFVARVLPPEVTSGPRAGLSEESLRCGDVVDEDGDGDDGDDVDDDDGDDDDRAAAGGGTSANTTGRARRRHRRRRFTPVWCRDSRGGAVVVPRAQEGPLRDHESSLILLGEDWYILGLRFEVDIEVRNVFNLHAFNALARGRGGDGGKEGEGWGGDFVVRGLPLVISPLVLSHPFKIDLIMSRLNSSHLSP